MQEKSRVAKLANGSAQLDNGSHAVRSSNDSFSVTPLLAKVRREALHNLGQCDSFLKVPRMQLDMHNASLTKGKESSGHRYDTLAREREKQVRARTLTSVEYESCY